MRLEGTPCNKPGTRNFNCPSYFDCLGYAAKNCWEHFSCSKCPNESIRPSETNDPYPHFQQFSICELPVHLAPSVHEEILA